MLWKQKNILVTFCTKIYQWQCQVGLVAQVCYSWLSAEKVTHFPWKIFLWTSFRDLVTQAHILLRGAIGLTWMYIPNNYTLKQWQDKCLSHILILHEHKFSSFSRCKVLHTWMMLLHFSTDFCCHKVKDHEFCLPVMWTPSFNHCHCQATFQWFYTVLWMPHCTLTFQLQSIWVCVGSSGHELLEFCLFLCIWSSQYIAWLRGTTRA